MTTIQKFPSLGGDFTEVELEHRVLGVLGVDLPLWQGAATLAAAVAQLSKAGREGQGI